MLIVINQLSVKPEFLDEVESAFLENVVGIEKQPGFVSFRFLRPLEPATTPCQVVVEWADAAAFDAWKQSAHFRQSHAHMGRFRDAFYGPPKMGQYSLAKSL